jgi:NAD(P)H-hydrate epimerase
MVIDADGLNCLSLNKEWFSMIPEKSILTPHPKEFERLVGTWENDEQKIEKLITLSDQLESIVVLKGEKTLISIPGGDLYVNSTGNPGMAKGGSGDVLTGMITAFLAQGYSSEESAILGVFIHGLAGDLAVKEFSEYGLLATDLIEFIPKAFLNLKNL